MSSSILKLVRSISLLGIALGGCMLILVSVALPPLSMLLLDGQFVISEALFGTREPLVPPLIRYVLEGTLIVTGAISAGYVCAAFARENLTLNLLIIALSFYYWVAAAAWLGHTLELSGGVLASFIGPNWWMLEPALFMLMICGAWLAPSRSQGVRTLLGYGAFGVIITGASMICAEALASFEAIDLVSVDDWTNKLDSQDRRLGLCIGHHPNLADEWGVVGGLCEADEVVFGGTREGSASRFAPGGSIGFAAACCPVPSRDILTDEHVLVTSRCPKDYVATSGSFYNAGCSSCPKPMRCTKINTERYELGELLPGAHWGHGSSFWQESPRLLIGDLPAAIRHGMTRIAAFHWRADGCTATVPGALLVEKAGRLCARRFYRRLRYRGAPGDPPRGTPVQMFPDCVTVTGIYGGPARCITAGPLTIGMEARR